MYSAACVALLKESEGVRLDPYFDPVGILTNGVGHVLRNGDPRGPVDMAQVEQWLAKDLTIAWDGVRRNVRVDLTQGQVDALTSFVLNEGERQFSTSTLLRLINLNVMDEAARQFERWTLAGGKVLPGLVKRREAERLLFIS